MTIDWFVAGALAFASLALLVFLQRRAQPRAWADWAVVSGDLRAAMVEWLRKHKSAHLRGLSRALRYARHEHDQPVRRTAKVRLALKEADDMAGRHVHFGLVHLRRWHGTARTLATLRPLPPRLAETLHAPTLRRLALVERLLALPLSDATRFLLGLRVQGWALHLIGWSFNAARRRAARDDALTRALHEMESGRDDLAALDDQALRLLAALLASLPEDGTA